MESTNILGVRIDLVNMDQALELIQSWLKKKQKRFIATPNVEFLMAAREDPVFRSILNESDLNIPDSSHFSWALEVLKSKGWISKAAVLPKIILPSWAFKERFPVLPGTDLLENLCQFAKDSGATVGFLGGFTDVAKKTKECLLKKYPGLKIVLAEAGPEVDFNGNTITPTPKYPKVDILFVAFGQVKQEKWIYNNLAKLDVKIVMGVGGAFDFLSGQVPRAPKFLRELGLEWLFRLIIQPWRIKRQLKLLKFVWIIMTTK